MRRFILAVLLIIVGSMSYKACTTKDFDVLPLSKKIGTFKLTGNNPGLRLVDDVNMLSCSAFVIDDTYALTAAHCINVSGELTKHKLKAYYNNSNSYVEVLAVGYDSSSDIGLLTGNFSDFKSLVPNFYDDYLFSHPDFIACGYPRGDSQVICNVFYVKSNTYDKIDGKGLFFHGMSGGPVIDTVTGQAVAIISSIGDNSVQVTPLQGFFGIFPKLR